jgi:hypothetical protein
MDREYWTKELREAEAQLAAAKRRTELNAAAKRLQRAKAELKRLEAEAAEWPKRRATAYARAVRDCRHWVRAPLHVASMLHGVEGRVWNAAESVASRVT